MRRFFGVLIAVGLLVPAHACEVRPGSPRLLADGGWQYEVAASASALASLDVRVREVSQDLDLGVRVGESSATSDVPPTRYAVERVTVPFWRSVRAAVRVRANEAATTRQLPLEVRCLDAWDAGWFAALWRTEAADQEFRARREPDAAVKKRLQAQALAIATGWHALTLGSERASASMLAGHLQSRLGRFVDAAASFREAEAVWSTLDDEDGPAHAARFYRAQATLAAGRADDAEALLVELTAADVGQRHPLIAGWAQNDRCVALRSAGRRSESVDCFAALLPVLVAAGERREAANVMCNMGAGLGVLDRWDEAATVLERCRAERQAIGTPGGLAHATLLLGWASLERGDVDAAAELFDQSLMHARAFGDLGRQWDARRWLAQTWIENDEIERARRELADNEPDTSQDAGRHADWQASMGTVALFLDDLADAARRLRAAESEYLALGHRLGVGRARCQLALIDPAMAVPDGCEAALLVEARRRRGDRDAALAALRTPQHAADGELLRRFLVALLDGGADRRERLHDIVARANALGTRSARGAGARERLLARLGFELAQASARENDASLARLAIVALLCSGERTALPAVALASLSSTRFDTTAPPTPLPALPDLADDEALVVSARYLGAGWLVVMRAGGQAFAVPVDLERLRISAATLRSAILDRQPAADAARSVAAALAVSGWLAPDVRRLRLSVQGELARLPWSAIAVDGAPVARLDYRPLADRVASSIVVPGAARTGAMPRRLAVVVGGVPDADSLPGVELEAAALRDAARRASWEIVDPGTAGAAPLGILHLGGHARADRGHADGGAFYIGDGSGWRRLALSDALVGRASLVVLAACETADGASGTLGNRSWGARVVERGSSVALAHLWPIDDTAAMRLHRAFYAAIFDGAEADVALALAQRARMRERVDAIPMRWASGVVFKRLASGKGGDHG